MDRGGDVSLKEKIAAAANAGSLKWTKSDEQDAERAVDRLAALGLAQLRVVNGIPTTRPDDALAAALWRFKYGKDHTRQTYDQVLHGITQRVHGRNARRAPSDTLRAVVAIALEEWRVESCNTCHGRKFVGGVYQHKPTLQDSKARPCPNCGGLGRIDRRPEERADAVMSLLRAVKMPAVRDLRRSWGKWGAHYQEALEVIGSLDSRLASKIKRKLGKDDADEIAVKRG
jgi:hypothetical protein